MYTLVVCLGCRMFRRTNEFRRRFREKIKLVLKATRQHARNLSTFAVIYKASMLVLRNLNVADRGKEGRYDSFFAGLLGGYAVFGRQPGSVSQQVCMHRKRSVAWKLTLSRSSSTSLRESCSPSPNSPSSLTCILSLLSLPPRPVPRSPIMPGPSSPASPGPLSCTFSAGTRRPWYPVCGVAWYTCTSPHSVVMHSPTQIHLHG